MDRRIGEPVLLRLLALRGPCRGRDGRGRREPSISACATAGTSTARSARNRDRIAARRRPRDTCSCASDFPASVVNRSPSVAGSLGMSAAMERVVLGKPISLERSRRRRAARAAGGPRPSGARSVGRLARAIDAIAAAGDAAPSVYGVNTGFGALSETRISRGATCARSSRTSCARTRRGVGPDLADRRGARDDAPPRAGARARPLRRARRARRSRSSRCSTRGVHPRIPSQGSVGASGDLAPLAHLALAMIGEGRGAIGERSAACRAPRSLARGGHRRRSCSRRRRGSRSSTARSTWPSLGTLALLDAERLCVVGRHRRRDEPRGAQGLEPPVRRAPARARARIPGQAIVATNLRALLADSEIAESHATAARCRTRTRSAACRRSTARRATRSRWVRERARARGQQRHRQPERLPRRRRRDRDHQRRQLPRPAARARARSRGDRGRRAREHQRAARRAAREPGALDRAHAVPRRRAAGSTRAS